MNESVKFTKEEYSFIEERFGIPRENVDAYSEDELYDLQDKCADIEADAIMQAGDDELSEDGEMASEIVTKIGSVLCSDEEDD